MSLKKTYFIFGAGFSGKAFGALASENGATVYGTTRSTEKMSELEALNIRPLLFDGSTITPSMRAALDHTTDLVISIAPGEDGDPVLRLAAEMLAKLPNLGWIAYLSTVGVYGNHDGKWVDEAVTCKPVSQRSIQRVAAETAWTEFARANDLPLAILRLSGIYGPRRNALKNIARPSERIDKILRYDLEPLHRRLDLENVREVVRPQPDAQSQIRIA